jgi:steroid delta-isomerase-like uncharacterized protein
MSTESNKAAVRRFMDEVINKGNLAVADEILSGDLVDHTAYPGVPPNREGRKTTIARLRGAFPDLRITEDEMVGEGDRLVIRHTIRGTHQHDFLGIPPTGARVEMGGVTVVRFAGGKIVEHWQYRDDLGLMRQLGALPTPQRAGA